MKHIALIVIAVFICGCGSSKKTASDYARDTAELRKLFPILEADQVTGLRYQYWCEVLAYKRGVFAHSTEGDPPRPATRDARRFDPTASADLERIWKRVKSSGAGVFLIENIKFDASGRVEYGEFRCGGSQQYIFDPGYTLPADIPNEVWHTKFDSDWYYVLEDWN